MDTYLFLVSLFAVLARPVRGSDEDYHFDIIQELVRTNSTSGITQVPGVHNGSKAFLFRDVSRSVLLPPSSSSRLLQMFRGKAEFTFLATVQQKSSTSGVIVSVHESEHSFFELASRGEGAELGGGEGAELVYTYTHRGERRSQTFPYRLSDGNWHRVSLSLSQKHLQLYVDCNRIYERVIDPPQTDLPQNSAVWLGQHSPKHGLFKGLIQDVKFVFAPNGFISQCPNLNRTCPTCSDFLSLVQGIMDLQELLAKMTLKLTYAESRLAQLEDCHCERTCSHNGVSYRDSQGWEEPENCRTCVCKTGVVECRRIFCPPTNCSEDSLPVHEQGTCCRTCRLKCEFMGQSFAEGQRFLSQDCRECKDGRMEFVSVSCPELNCSFTEQLLPEGNCCNVCAGHDFCAEGVVCGLNSDCENLRTRAQCVCRHGYASAHGDQSDCEDVDECSSPSVCGFHSVCVNVPGSYRCDCESGYFRETQYSCTPLCEDGCLSGGTCVAPNTCVCAPGFTGANCESDIDECSDARVQCHSRSLCVNLPGTFHCNCRPGYHDDGTDQPDGSSCVDIDECALRLHSCSVDSVCVNAPGGFSCLCTSAPDCAGGACPQPGGATLHGEEWTPSHDPCSICSCKEGQVQCAPLPCPALSCSYSTLPQGECCPRCVSDPCAAQEVPPPALGLGCRDQSGSQHLSGDTWHLPNSPCTTCQCKNGSVCCAVDLDCLQNN